MSLFTSMSCSLASTGPARTAYWLREAFVKEELFSDVPFSQLCPFFPPAVRKDPHRVPVTTAQYISYLAMMLSGGKTMVDD
jgi:hypothetical protein